MSSEKRYFNFPIQLLEGFLVNKEKCLDDILHFSLYDHAKNKLTYGNLMKRLLETASYYELTMGSPEYVEGKGEDLYFEYGKEKVKVGLSTEIFWDFKSNPKTPFEDACLLAYLALRSILRDKPFCKVTNLYWLSRMDGNSHAVEHTHEFSEAIMPYSNEYQLKKIKFHLTDSWNMVHYARYTRGFYISFKMKLEDLVYQVEKKRKSLKMRQQKDAEKLALKLALEKLKNE